MKTPNKDTALLELEKAREQMLGVVNKSFDDLKARLEKGEDMDGDTLPCEIIYPLNTTPAFLNGLKPAAVIFGDERIEVAKWREAYTLILRRCYDDRHDTLIPNSMRTCVYRKGKQTRRKRK